MFTDAKNEEPVGRLIPAKVLGLEIGGTGKSGGRRTIGRGIKADLDFPQVYRINGRLYVREADWENYKIVLLRRGAEANKSATARLRQNAVDAAVADIFDAICGALNREPGIAAYDLGELLSGVHANVENRLRDLLGENTHAGAAL
jgi:hypothetical protein